MFLKIDALFSALSAFICVRLLRAAAAKVHRQVFEPGAAEIRSCHPLEQNAVLWSRLLLLSIPYQQYPDDPPLMIVSDRFTKSLTLGGDSYHYCKTDWQGNNLALVVSDLPVFLSFRSFDSVNDHLKEIARLRFPAIINNWIDRQENPELAFYQYWTLSECLKDRKRSHGSNQKLTTTIV